MENSMTNHLFKPTALLCQCGKAHLVTINRLILCEKCGWYKINRGVINLKYS